MISIFFSQAILQLFIMQDCQSISLEDLNNDCYTHFIKINLAYILAVQIQPLLYSNTTAMSCPVLHGHFVFLEGRVGLFTEKFTREPCPSFIQTGNRSKPHEQYKNHPHSPVLQRQVRTYYNTQYNHPFHTLADASRPASQQLFGQISPKSLLPVPHRSSSSNENWSHTATTMTSTARHRDAVNNQHIKYEICVFIFSREIQFGTTRRTVNLYSQYSIVNNSNL